MRRREQREHVFKLMFMTEFNSEEEMTEQLSLYFEGLGELSEQDQEYMKKKYAHVKEHLEEIDAQLNNASRGWKTKRMGKVELTILWILRHFVWQYMRWNMMQTYRQE